MMIPFLRCVAKVLLKGGLNAVTFGIGGDLLDELWNEWGRHTEAEQRRKELEAVAQLGQKPAQQQAAAAVAAEASRQPPEVQQVLTTYLAQLPAHFRRSLRRPSDPTGTTVTPDLVPHRGEDLRPLLPERLPRFKSGDRPLAGVPWVLEEMLGVGGFGEVWKARHPSLPGLHSALKFCLDPTARERLLHHEARVIAQVQQHGKHPGMVELRQAYLENDPPCLEYEYVQGGELTDWFAQQPVIPAEMPHRIILGLANTVGFAHRLDPAVVHRDLKPANILVVPGANGKVRFKVADYGIGGLLHVQSGRAGTRPTMLANAYTQLYASPQQKASRPPHPTDDVYSLGVIWYQLVTLNLAAEPPHGRAWRKQLLRAGVDERLLDLLESCIEDDSQHRPTDAKSLATCLESLLKPAVTQPKPDPPEKPEPFSSATPAKPHAAWGSSAVLRWLVLVVAILSVVAVLGYSIWLIIQSSLAPKIEVFTDLKMKFAFVEKGTFWMSEGGENARKQVTIPYDFYIGVYDVTQGQWREVMNNNPSFFSRRGEGNDRVKDIPDEDLDQFPVEQVSWDDTQVFLEKLNEKEKDSGWLYRLPKEAEWEYACRGGAISKEECSYDYYLQQPTDDLSSTAANFNGRNPRRAGAPKGIFLFRTTKVGSYPPNRLGIYDMHGNVWQWCDDLYETDGVDRAIRGGGWNCVDSSCWAGCRRSFEPASRHNCVLGFRVARVPSGSR